MTATTKALRTIAAAQSSPYLRTMTNKAADDLDDRTVALIAELRQAAREAGSQTTTGASLRNLAEMFEDGRLTL